MSAAVALLDLTVRTLHAPAARHGVARCGAVMRDPWQCGPAELLAERAARLCPECWPEWAGQ
jgi:hypothetical protein